LIRRDDGDALRIVDKRLYKILRLLKDTELDQDVDDSQEPHLILHLSIGVIAAKASVEVWMSCGGQ
jgi:hypothetical protein